MKRTESEEEHNDFKDLVKKGIVLSLFGLLSC